MFVVSVVGMVFRKAIAIVIQLWRIKMAMVCVMMMKSRVVPTPLNVILIPTLPSALKVSVKSLIHATSVVGQVLKTRLIVIVMETYWTPWAFAAGSALQMLITMEYVILWTPVWCQVKSLIFAVFVAEV
jgi:hypothetical protein